MSMSLFACGQSGSKDDGQKKFKVAINHWGQANFFGRVGKEAMEDELTKLGCEIIPTVTDNTPDRMKAIENAIALGVDAIIVQEGDIIDIDIEAGKLDVRLSDDELERRRAAWQPPAPKYASGVLSRYAKLVTSADKGAYLS